MSRKWAIIAVDFTCAGDSTVQFVSQGEPVLFPVMRDPDIYRPATSKTIVVNTDSRSLDSTVASSRVARFTRLLCSGAPFLVRRIKEGIEKGIRIFIPDAGTIGDLNSIAFLADLSGIFFVGSLGLAKAFDAHIRAAGDLQR